MKTIIAFFLLLGALACTSDKKIHEDTEVPTNIIFLIGDGMGLSAVSTTVYYGDNYSDFSRFNEIGLSITSSATHKVTDSAASGTAMAAGKKTYNGAIGVDTAKVSIENFTELVSPLGWATGLVATSSITHATPASFYAHVEQRGMEEEIAFQLLDSEIDFFAGGGIGFFNKRADGVNLLGMTEEKGFIVDTVSLADPGISVPRPEIWISSGRKGDVDRFGRAR